MEKFKSLIIISIISLFLFSCKSELTAPLVFNVKIDNATVVVNDTLVVKKDTPLNFTFEGNPQFISYYSGETGKEFAYYNTSVIPVSEFDSCLLKFDVTPNVVDGNIENTLSLFISDKFPGISGISSTPDFAKDSANIRNSKEYNWTDLTTACQFPRTNNTKVSVKLDMMPFMSKNICFKFRYQTVRNDVDQPKWTVANLKIIRYQHGKVPFEIPASSLAFRQFDILNKTSAYAVFGAGVWSKSNPANIFINSTLAGNPLNEDYLISTPIMINPLLTASTGDLVKNLSVYVDRYSYTYRTKGIYAATFLASNVNYSDNGQYKQVSFVVKVVD